MQRVNLVGDSGVTHGAAIAIAGVSKPIFVSIGHKISLDTAVDVVIRSSIHRIPEPVRQADLTSREMLRKLSPDAVTGSSVAEKNRIDRRVGEDVDDALKKRIESHRISRKFAPRCEHPKSAFARETRRLEALGANHPNREEKGVC